MQQTNKQTKLLKFQRGNAKLGKEIYTFSLPAGHSCPFANNCLSKADKITGKLTDGPNTQFRCFAASAEAVYPNVRLARWYNFDLLKKLDTNKSANLILSSLPKKANIVRIHVSGDFFNEAYFLAWLKVAKERPEVLFYAYTKSLVYWVNYIKDIPTNLILNASEGGKLDAQINGHGLKFAKVVYSPSEAKKLGLKIDHTDEAAYKTKKSFALLIHGQQPKGSKASQAIKELKAKNIKYSYSN
jgi:hypothetical protein